MNSFQRICYGICLVLLLAVSTFAAPVTKTEANADSKAKTSVKAESVAAAEKELQALMHEGGDSVPLPKSSEEQLKSEPEALPKETAPVESQEEPASDAVLPAKRLPSMNDSPAPRLPTGLEETGQYAEEPLPSFSQDAAVLRDIAQPSIDLTPQAAAEYLIVTGDFNGFEEAIRELIKAQVLSPEEVEQYKDAVSLAYETMMQQVAEAEREYVQEAARPFDTEYYNNLPQREVPYVLPSSDYIQEPDLYLESTFQNDLRQAQYQRAMEREQQAALDQLLDSVLNEYYMSAPVEQEETMPVYNVEPETANSNPKDLDKMLSWMEEILREEQANEASTPDEQQQVEVPSEEETEEDVAKELEALDESTDDTKSAMSSQENETTDEDTASYDKKAKVDAESSSA